MEELLSLGSPFIVRHLLDQEGHLHHLFFAHRSSLELFKAHPEVLLLDCTYKTNKFHMPFLKIVRVTSMNSTFFVAFCFMRQEKEEDFYWVFQQLQGVYWDHRLETPMSLSWIRT